MLCYSKKVSEKVVIDITARKITQLAVEKCGVLIGMADGSVWSPEPLPDKRIVNAQNWLNASGTTVITVGETVRDQHPDVLLITCMAGYDPLETVMDSLKDLYWDRYEQYPMFWCSGISFGGLHLIILCFRNGYDCSEAGALLPAELHHTFTKTCNKDYVTWLSREKELSTRQLAVKCVVLNFQRTWNDLGQEIVYCSVLLLLF